MKPRRLCALMALLFLLPAIPLPLARAGPEEETGRHVHEARVGHGVAFVQLLRAGEPTRAWTAGDEGWLVVGARVEEGPEMVFRATVFYESAAGEVAFDQGPPAPWGDIVGPGVDHGREYAFVLREGAGGADAGEMRFRVRVEARTLDGNASRPLVAELEVSAPVDMAVARRSGTEWPWRGPPAWMGSGSALFGIGLLVGLAMGRTRWDLGRP